MIRSSVSYDMRELTAQEFEEVAGGPGPLVYLVGAAIVAAGSAIGGYLAGSSSSNSGSAANGASVNCPEGTAPKVSATEATFVKVE